MKNCYGYIRVSTKTQVEDGQSLVFQEKTIRRYAEQNNYNIINIFKEKGKSGREIKNRNILHDVLKVMKKGDTLLLYSITRLVRNTKLFFSIDEDLKDKGCFLYSVTDSIETETTDGKCRAGFAAVLAEHESNRLSDRVKEGMKSKKEKGEFVGRISYGWKLKEGKGSDLVEVPEQQEVIKKIREMKLKRVKLDDIVSYLIDNNIAPPKTSKEWKEYTIRNILKRGPVNTKGRGC